MTKSRTGARSRAASAVVPAVKAAPSKANAITAKVDTTPQGYYRYPTIHGDRLVFVSEDDLWEVSAQGGAAQRLTLSQGASMHPALSPDGQWLAFTSSDEGTGEVFVMPSGGGVPKRLTFESEFSQVIGWRPDSKRIWYTSSARQPFAAQSAIFEVSPLGGESRQVKVGDAVWMSQQPGGKRRVIGRHMDDCARWKRYRGGMAGVLWVERKSGRGQFKPLIDLPGNLVRPLWVQDRIYFVSDHEGIGNLYSCTPDGDDLRCHSEHDMFFARHPSTDGKRIVYHAGADLFLFDPAQNTSKNPKDHLSRRVDVRLRSARAQCARRFVAGASFLEDATLHPRGHMLGLIARGKPHIMGLFEGAVWRVGERHGVRYRLARFLADGKRMVVVSDEGGEEALELFELDSGAPSKRFDDLDVGRPLDMHASPFDDVVVFSNHRYELVKVDLATGTATILDRSPFERLSGIAFSPCGHFVAYACSEQPHTSCIKLANLADATTHRLTPVEFRDTDPSFDPDGRFLFFLSMRDFDPVPDVQSATMGFPEGMRICLLTLNRDLTSPFSKEPRPLDEDLHSGSPRFLEGDAPNPSADPTQPPQSSPSDPDAPPPRPDPTRIDLDGIERRVLLLPVPPGDFGQVACDGDRVFYTVFPVRASLDADDDDDDSDGRLEVFDLETLEESTAMDDVSGFEMGTDNKTLLVFSDGRLRALSARHCAPPSGSGPPPEPPSGDRNPGRKSGWINLSRVGVEVSPVHEWRQMLSEAWRLMRDHFWDVQMSGVDWAAVRDRYAPLVERIGCRGEFSDLIWELQGELCTSHAYETGGDYRLPPLYLSGQLGVDVVFDSKIGALRIERIIEGDPWDEGASSPLVRPGLQVQEGDWIVSVNGEPVEQNTPLSAMLLNTVGHEVSIGVISQLPDDSTCAAPTDDAEANPDPTPITSEDLCPPPTPLDEPSEVPTPDDSPLAPPPDDDPSLAPRLVTVRTLLSDRRARYRDWVSDNRRRTHDRSEGRIGYIHIPDMGPEGFGAFHRAFLLELNREALIIDVRYNSGGHISALLLEKLARRRLGYDFQRWGAPIPYPVEARRGPTAALINEYTGSDGDVFGHSFKLLGLGPVIGRRSWGGVIGTWPRHHLVDGSITSQPEFAFWFEDVGWQIENRGATPDIDIDISPQDQAAGRDPQLDRAIDLLLSQPPPKIPSAGSPPNLAPPWQQTTSSASAPASTPARPKKAPPTKTKHR